MLASFCLTLLTLNSTVTVIDEAVVPAKSANVSSTTSVTEPAENTTTAAAADKVAPQEAAAGEGALSASPTAHGVAEQAVQAWLLRYQFQDGQKLRYQTTQKMTLDATRGQKREVDLSELRQRRVFTVLSVDADQSARIAMQFENVWMRSKAGDREAVEFNSNMKPGMVPPAFRQVAHELKGSAPKYWLSATGVSMYPVAKKPSVAKSQESVNDAAESVIDLVEGESTNSKIQLVSKTNHGLTQQEEKNLSDPGLLIARKTIALFQTL